MLCFFQVSEGSGVPVALHVNVTVARLFSYTVAFSGLVNICGTAEKTPVSLNPFSEIATVDDTFYDKVSCEIVQNSSSPLRHSWILKGIGCPALLMLNKTFVCLVSILAHI